MLSESPAPASNTDWDDTTDERATSFAAGHAAEQDAADERDAELDKLRTDAHAAACSALGRCRALQPALERGGFPDPTAWLLDLTELLKLPTFFDPRPVLATLPNYSNRLTDYAEMRAASPAALQQPPATKPAKRGPKEKPLTDPGENGFREAYRAAKKAAGVGDVDIAALAAKWFITHERAKQIADADRNRGKPRKKKPRKPKPEQS